MEALGCSVKALKRSGVRTGDVVLIIGLGVMGQLNGLLARRYGAKLVLGADLVPYRLNKMLELGGDAVVNVAGEDLRARVRDLTDGAMADVVVVGPGSPSAMELGLSCVGKGGTVMLFTPSAPEETLAIRPYDLYFNEVTLLTSYSCGPYDTRESMDLIEQGVVAAGQLITHRFRIEDAAEGFKKAKEAGSSLKAVIVADGEPSIGSPDEA